MKPSGMDAEGFEPEGEEGGGQRFDMISHAEQKGTQNKLDMFPIHC